MQSAEALRIASPAPPTETREANAASMCELFFAAHVATVSSVACASADRTSSRGRDVCLASARAEECTGMCGNLHQVVVHEVTVNGEPASVALQLHVIANAASPLNKDLAFALQAEHRAMKPAPKPKTKKTIQKTQNKKQSKK